MCGIFDVEEIVVEVAVDGDDNVELLDEILLWLVPGRFVDCVVDDDENDELWVVVGVIVVAEDNDIIEDTVVEPLDDVKLWLVVVGFVDVNGKVVLLDVIVLLDDDDVVDLRVVVVGQFV